MELTVNFKPAAELGKAYFNFVNNGALSIAKCVSHQAERVNEFLFVDGPEAAFTFSAFGTLAVSTLNPGLLAVGLGTSVFSSFLLECKSEKIAFDDEVVEASSLEVNDKPVEDPKELTESQKEVAQERVRGDDFYNLAITNATMTLVSNILLGDNRLGIATLAVTTAVRLMQ